jgi:hypothetical protein
MKRSSRLICRQLSGIFALTAGIAATEAVFAQPRAQLRFGLGDQPVPADQYERSQITYNALDTLGGQQWDLSTMPEFDARQRGWVTDPKNQGSCGCCWAFAAVGTIESRILKDGGPRLDLSEQQEVSCNSNMHGCCGGSGTSLMFFYSNQPLKEGDAGYSEAGTNCPTEHTTNCGSLSGTPAPYLATGFYTVQQNVEAFKLSLLNHGPSYFRFTVYDDFGTYWDSGAAGSVYKQTAGGVVGGHAVLLIGWSESKQAFLLKNSWGATGGPNHDGTFWMAYTGHASDLNIQMFNISGLTRVATPASGGGDGSSADQVSRMRTPTKLRSLKQDNQKARVPEEKSGHKPSPVESEKKGAFMAPEGYLKSLSVEAAAKPEQPDRRDASDAGFSWYNNCRVNGNTNLLGTEGTTQVSVFAQDVAWRYAFGGPLVNSPTGDGGSGGSGWRFPNAHRFGIVVYQGDRYWNVDSSDPSSPTVISGLSNTVPITVTVNDTNNNYDDNGGAVDIYVRRDN